MEVKVTRRLPKFGLSRSSLITNAVIAAMVLVLTGCVMPLVVQQPDGALVVAMAPGTDNLPVCTVQATNLNLRTGPGVNYPRKLKMPAGTEFATQAQNGSGAWLAGVGLNESGWAAAAFMDCPDAIDELPVVALRPVPPESAPPVDPLSNDVGRAAANAVSGAGAVRAASAPSFNATNFNTNGLTASLVEPQGRDLAGRVLFRWAPSGDLQPGLAYELVFWKPGQDPLSDSFGPVGVRQEPEAWVDLDKTTEYLPVLFSYDADYEWGVLLVRQEPYQRLAFLGGGRPFRLLNGGNPVAGSDDGPDPKPTNEALPDNPDPEPEPEPPRPPAPGSQQ